MQSMLKIMYISSEVAPFLKTGGLADVAGALPKAIKDLNHDIRIFMPKYSTINERRYTLREVIRLKDIEVPLGGKKILANVKSAFVPDSKVQIYFVESKDYFQTADFAPMAPEQELSHKLAEQLIFFNRSIFEILKILHWQPDIIHCNDWQTALIPLFLKTIYQGDPFFNRIRTLLSIHNWAYQGICSREVWPRLDGSDILPQLEATIAGDEKLNFLKIGIIFADMLNTVSKNYAQEVKTSDEYAYGLSSLLKSKTKEILGITNGIDYKVWNPETDPLIPYVYSVKDPTQKLANKRFLVESQGLKFDERLPVMGTISRLTNQKGIDLIAEVFDELMKLDLQYILLGLGDEKFHRFFQSAARKYGRKFAFNLKFDDQLAHQIEAGCDLYLMPSRVEPCGLNQLYSLKYGTIPIVHATGGLADTIKDYDPKSGRGYGFVFQKYAPEALINAVRRALDAYRDREIWRKLIDRAMRLNFSWQLSAEKYIRLYYKLIS
ncbi:MAG: glycogen synthase [candidate division KSB1 bacterium]|nr:glycogen synthase [candidate division KSB1 bacterium]MDZ7319172.1 glycogen synthase [candidate division KSB1 bacterium]MDZ7341423.1 glycogen synthase [candidate division KSB1 bacterium]